MAKKKIYTSKDARKRAKGAIIGAVLHMIAVTILGVLTFVHLLQLSGDGDAVTDGVANSFEPYLIPYGLAAIAYIASLVVNLVLFLMWVHRTNRNAQALSAGMDVRPGWAVGWFFIPFASLYKPFQGLDQTWRVSIDPSRWRGLDTPTLLRWWWGFHLTSNIAGSMSNIVGKSEGAVFLALSTAIAIMSFIAGFIASALAIRMIKRLTATQTSTLEAAAFA
jgi:ABC-type multidrug transport system fused ATPase/permease subunit